MQRHGEFLDASPRYFRRQSRCTRIASRLETPIIWPMRGDRAHGRRRAQRVRRRRIGSTASRKSDTAVTTRCARNSALPKCDWTRPAPGVGCTVPRSGCVAATHGCTRHGPPLAAGQPALRLPDQPRRRRLLVALDIDDKPLRLALAELGIDASRGVAGSAAPPQEVVDAVVVEPHGWRILRPV